MRVLIIGYGKIGRIKAFLWKKLGFKVYIFDINNNAEIRALKDGFKLFDGVIDKDTIVDISSSSGQHFNSLKWLIDYPLTNLPKLILIEKPLFSSDTENNLYKKLLKTNKQKNLMDRIYLNDSYYESEGLKLLVNSIDSKIKKIIIELSKNRLHDIENGRFSDEELMSIGIEVPHILAVLQILNIDLKKIGDIQSRIFKDSEKEQNQGTVIKFKNEETTIEISSFLGDFKISDDTIAFANNDVRKVIIETINKDFLLEFDPIKGLPRYHSRLSTNDKQNKVNKVVTIQDNHLVAHMKKLIVGEQNKKLTGYDNAEFLARLLIDFKNRSHILKINFKNIAGNSTLSVLNENEGVQNA